MKRHHAVAPLAAAYAALVLLPLALPARPAVAQSRSRVPVREQNIRESEQVMRQMERDTRKPPTSKEAALALAEINEDFGRLQEVNNSMMSAVTGAAAPDYKLVAEALGEIRRRAERLRTNLKLPPAEAVKTGGRPAPAAAETAAELKEALLALDRSITNFVTNPIFQMMNVIDAEAAARASRDLADVIERSRRAGKDAARLGKKSAAP